MNAKEYQKAAMQTAAAAPDEDPIKGLNNAALGLWGELSELIFELQVLEVEPGSSLLNIKEELGDVMWYFARAYFAMGVEMPQNFPRQLTNVAVPGIKATAKENLHTLLISLGRKFGDEVKKLSHQGHPFNKDMILAMLNLYLHPFYFVCRTQLGFEISEIFEANIAKLQARYPKGFATERSVNRNV